MYPTSVPHFSVLSKTHGGSYFPLGCMGGNGNVVHNLLALVLGRNMFQVPHKIGVGSTKSMQFIQNHLWTSLFNHPRQPYIHPRPTTSDNPLPLLFSANVSKIKQRFSI